MPDKTFHFDTALKELESITQWFEQNEIDLDEGLVKFERGMVLATELKNHLETVENRIEKIKVRFNAKTEANPARVDQPLYDEPPAGMF